MNPLSPSDVPGYRPEPPGPSLRSVVRKSALLNLTVVLTSFPVLVFAGGPAAVIPVLAIMMGITILIWMPRSQFSRLSHSPESSGLRPEPGNLKILHVELPPLESPIAGWTSRFDGEWEDKRLDGQDNGRRKQCEPRRFHHSLWMYRHGVKIYQSIGMS